jgi:NIMA-interacting peptidyl-prolyl cis-trans isomerase 4
MKFLANKMPKGNKKSSKKAGAASAEEEKSGGRLKTCNQVKARHILCEKLSKLQEPYDQLYAAHGNRPPPQEFARVRSSQLAEQLSECPSAKRGGDLGWFPRGKMVGAFQEVAFSLEPGTMSTIFRSP